MGEGFEHFLNYWLAGLLQGLEAIDENSRAVVLRACGTGCADSYTAQLFRDTKEQSVNLKTFLETLAQRFPEATYERTGPQEIRVTYSRCACDLVTLGFTRSPVLCQCSAFNLQANFERAFGTEVEVSLQSSILRQKSECVFVVSFQEDPERFF